jgi:hypothetical protein
MNWKNGGVKGKGGCSGKMGDRDQEGSQSEQNIVKCSWPPRKMLIAA